MRVCVCVSPLRCSPVLIHGTGASSRKGRVCGEAALGMRSGSDRYRVRPGPLRSTGPAWRRAGRRCPTRRVAAASSWHGPAPSPAQRSPRITGHCARRFPPFGDRPSVGPVGVAWARLFRLRLRPPRGSKKNGPLGRPRPPRARSVFTKIKKLS